MLQLVGDCETDSWTLNVEKERTRLIRYSAVLTQKQIDVAAYCLFQTRCRNVFVRSTRELIGAPPMFQADKVVAPLHPC